MKISDDSEPRPVNGRTGTTYPISMVVASLVALIMTFLLASSSLGVTNKTFGFSGIIALFLTACGLLYFLEERRVEADSETADAGDERTARHLTALDDANEFFSGVLKQADTFRLVASRVKPLLPFRAIELLVLDETRMHLTVAEIDGPDTIGRMGLILYVDDGLAGRSVGNHSVEFGHEVLSEMESPSVAIPLEDGARVYGVLQLYFDRGYLPDVEDPSIYEAIGVRVSPLMLSSIAFEKSQANALTDATTDLPNERAFYLVLENQIAEAMRKGGDRPLTIFTVDIKGFDEINSRFGHAAGDRVLNYVAQTVSDNLRQMDFFARSVADEFLAILPTASKEVSHDVIARVQTGFFGRKLKLTDTDSIEVDINIGWATFGTDGETAGQLLSAARLRKDQSKTSVPGKVLWFSKEMIN